jgi:hypothetical protein
MQATEAVPSEAPAQTRQIGHYSWQTTAPFVAFCSKPLRGRFLPPETTEMCVVCEDLWEAFWRDLYERTA